MCGKHFQPENPDHVKWLKRKISIYFAYGMKFFGYYLDDGSPVGFASLLMDKGPKEISYLGYKCELVHIGVYPQYRGKGYGAELLKSTEEYARNEGFYCLYITTYEGNDKARKFYEEHGYSQVAILPDVHGPNDKGQVYLRKILHKDE